MAPVGRCKVADGLISFWLTHSYLRRVGKRYPEFFTKYINDITDNKRAREIMLLRYAGEDRLSFKEIAYKLNVDIRTVFEHHKNIINRMISP